MMDLTRLTVTFSDQRSDMAPPPASNEEMNYFVYSVISFIMSVSVVAVQHINDLYLSEEQYQTTAA